MSIASEITRLTGAKADIIQAITDKGVTVPSSAKLDDMALLIASITGGGGANEGLLKLGTTYYPYREINGKLWTLCNLAWIPTGITLNPGSWNNDSAKCVVYGGNNNGYYLYGLYYNYKAVEIINSSLEDGWHVANRNDWNNLIAYLGGGASASLKLNAFFDPNNGTNTEGINLYALGVRDGSNMVGAGSYSYFPLDTNGSLINCMRIGTGSNGLGETTRTLSSCGFTVRLCKDA